MSGMRIWMNVHVRSDDAYTVHSGIVHASIYQILVDDIVYVQSNLEFELNAKQVG